MNIERRDRTLAWAHREFILDNEDIDSCIFEQEMTIEILSDIPPTTRFRL
ncbi:hypothetical protein JJD41_23045 [Oxynema sp. CENA135]|nr:hypothetical protein [Oxynema sp. CENA135]MBK4732720.1 hypothetical protein [Oxynema sp. CENA135]